MDTEQKLDALGVLFDEWDSCQRCGLCAPAGRTRNHVVFGEGNPDATLMIIGGSPGGAEDATGRPFAGRAGDIVEMFLTDFRSSREEVFLTDVVACRATSADDPAEPRSPLRAEVNACAPRLNRIVDIVDPYVILLLGAEALSALGVGKRSLSEIAKDRHQFGLRAETRGTFMPIQRPALATWHPEYLITRWSEKPGDPVYQAYLTWSEAFRLADEYARLYRGVEPPMRGGGTHG